MDIVLSGQFGTLGAAEPITLNQRRLALMLLGELGLERQAVYTYDMLSKGERQIVLIARALFAKPSILILDEPCTGLDIYHRAYLFKALEHLAERGGLTIIYVTHYAQEIKPFFDQCLLLRNGRCFASGSTEELLTDQTISSLLGYPAEVRRDEQKTLHIEVKDIRPQIADYL